MKPRLLDLFCGAGGAAMGYHRAGFEVVGVDIKPQPNFPFEFHQADALALVRDASLGCYHESAHSLLAGRLKACLGEFDAIHASPPCQAYSVLRRANIGTEYPDLVEPTRALLEASGLPYIIENVPGAPLRTSVILCGSMFDLKAKCEDGTVRQLRRHRLFESNIHLWQPECAHDGEAIGVYGGGRSPRWTFEKGATKDPYGRRGGYQGTMAEKSAAMDIDWMPGSRLSQAIPPAYTEYLGRQLLEHLSVGSAVKETREEDMAADRTETPS